MDTRGEPCKGCGQIILVYSSSGYCRECWHKRRGGRTFPGSKVKKEATSDKKVV